MSNSDLPETVISVTLDSVLLPLFGPHTPLRKTLVGEIERGAKQLGDTLGVPGVPTVRIDFQGRGAKRSLQWLRMRVNGLRCDYPDELLSRVFCYVFGMPFDLSIGADEMPGKMLDHSNGAPGMPGEEQDRLVELLGRACMEIIKRRPSVLLGPAQTEAYLARLTEGEEPAGGAVGWAEDPGGLQRILAEVLDLRLSISDRRIGGILRKARQDDLTREAVVESLVGILRPATVEIRVAPEYLRSITQEHSAGFQYFTSLRQWLFSELGTTYPDFAFVPDESRKAGSFAFRINHLECTPWHGLGPDQYLVIAVPEQRGDLEDKVYPVTNPATREPSGVIDRSLLSRTEFADTAALSALEYMALCLYADLRAHSAHMLDERRVREALKPLEQSSPALARAALGRVTLTQLTRTLRALLVESVSIRDLSLILDAILDFDWVVGDDVTSVVLDNRLTVLRPPSRDWLEDPRNLADSLRIALKRGLCFTCTEGQTTLAVHRLDAGLQREIALRQADNADLSDELLDSILEGVHAAVSSDTPSTPPAVALTPGSLRRKFREIISPRFPRLPVLAYQEMCLGITIQFLGDIAIANGSSIEESFSMTTINDESNNKDELVQS